MTLLICVTAIIIAIYFKPLIILRIKSKKVKIQYVSAEGKKVKAALYLTRDFRQFPSRSSFNLTWAVNVRALVSN